MKKNFIQAPLPFQGQKRRFAGEFRLQVKELAKKNNIRIVVDLFGGSGLLSRIAKDELPGADVVYNDFDGYSQRLRNVGRTNTLLADIRAILIGYPGEKRIESPIRERVLDRIKRESGYVDYITLSASLLFSGKYAIDFEFLEKQTLYNNVRAADYDFDPDSYLAGLTIVCEDYKVLFDRYKDKEGVLFLVDPPYLSTDTSTYHSDKYWKLRDYLDVLKVLHGTNYFFFTSDKSQLVELCEWLGDNQPFDNPFRDSVLNVTNNQLNKSAKYTDMMLCRIV